MTGRIYEQSSCIQLKSKCFLSTLFLEVETTSTFFDSSTQTGESRAEKSFLFSFETFFLSPLLCLAFNFHNIHHNELWNFFLIDLLLNLGRREMKNFAFARLSRKIWIFSITEHWDSRYLFLAKWASGVVYIPRRENRFSCNLVHLSLTLSPSANFPAIKKYYKAKVRPFAQCKLLRYKLAVKLNSALD